MADRSAAKEALRKARQSREGAASEGESKSVILDRYSGEVVQEVRGSVPFYRYSDPGLVDWFTAEPWQVYALIERAEWFAEKAAAVWDLTELKPCWKKHPDVVMLVSGLERAWVQFHRGDDLSVSGLFRGRLDLAREQWRASPMRSCQAGVHNRRLLAVTDPIDQRRSLYVSPAEVHGMGAYPSRDESGRWFTGDHLRDDGVHLGGPFAFGSEEAA